jgi:CubicO group peptidase (beta-lactamase class C family)
MMTRILLALATLPIFGASLPTSKPEDVGISSERLKRISTLVKSHIDAGDFSGAVTLVARKGKVVHLEAQGLRDIEMKKPMTVESVFQLASMTKPITAVAVLMLMEEGKLLLGDPVSKFIPEFKNQKVAQWNLPNDPRGAGRRLVLADREITLQDLLTHTSGMASSNDGPAGSDFAKLKIGPDTTVEQSIKEWASVPLNFQPGTQWEYTGTVGFGVLGRVVEIVSGMPLDRFFETKILTPLGMKDSFYRIPATRQVDVAVMYSKQPSGLTKVNSSGLVSGAGGLWSNAQDYLAFSQMLLNGGQLNGVRILSRKSVELMSDNAIGDLDLRNYIGTEHNLAGYGFGLGVRVRKSSGRSGWLGSPGDFGWAGAQGTYSWIDPKEQTIGIIMMSTRVQRLRAEFPNVVYGSFID